MAFLSGFQGLLKMKLLPRLRYILEVVRPSPRVVQDILEILTRIARHSSSSATQVATVSVTSFTMSGQHPPTHLTSAGFTKMYFTQVLDCPRLMEMLLSEFLPTSWTASSLTPPRSVYGLPLARAMKLLRILATSGRHACARLVRASKRLASGFRAR